ncbi:MAG: hypothetical protein AAF449_12970 [Myxococcota bacterium]
MRHRNGPMIRVGLALALAAPIAVSGCGEDTHQTPLAIEFSSTSQPLLTGVTRVVINLHPGRQTCTALAQTGPNFDAPYSTEIRLDGPQNTVQSSIFNIVDDIYTASAWGFGPNGVARVHGCSEPFSVERGRQSTAQIELRLRI